MGKTIQSDVHEEPYNEKHARSLAKSVLWRSTGVFILALVTYAYTRKFITAGVVTIIHHGIFLVVYYLHERIWLKQKWPTGLKARSVIKMITYETICGNIVLGTVSYLLTGNWKTVTAVTLTYIGIKHVIYILNEFVWKKIYWGCGGSPSPGSPSLHH